MGRPAQFDRAAILAASLELADEQGLAAVTMHAVADRLGVTPMALYRHVANKADLLDGMVESILLEVPLPDPADEWPDRLGDLRPPEALTIALQPAEAATPDARQATLCGWPDRIGHLP